MRIIEIIIATIDHIEAHLGEPLMLGRLAQKMGYSRYHLHRRLTKTVGIPIHAYIQRRRLTEEKYRKVSDTHFLRTIL